MSLTSGIYVKSRISTGPEEQLWGPKDLAHYLGVSERTAIRRMKRDFAGFRVGKLWRIRPEDARTVRVLSEASNNGGSTCADQEILRARLRADLRIYREMVAQLTGFHDSTDRVELARLAFEAARKLLEEHMAQHGCVASPES